VHGLLTHNSLLAPFLNHRSQPTKQPTDHPINRHQPTQPPTANETRCSVDPKFLDISHAVFGLPQTLTVSIKNEGAVDANFYYVSPPRPHDGHPGDPSRVTWDDDQPPCPPWLRLIPEEGSVEAGECRSIGLMCRPPKARLVSVRVIAAFHPENNTHALTHYKVTPNTASHSTPQVPPRSCSCK
jgi:hypothetical protein